MNNEKMTLFKIVLFYDIPQVIVTRKGGNYYIGFVIAEGELALRYFMHNVHSMEALDDFLMGSISECRANIQKCK